MTRTAAFFIATLAATSSLGCAHFFASNGGERGGGGEQHEAAQDLTPVRAIEMYLDGFHIYKTEEGLPAENQRQVRVAHYCVHAEPEFIQCVLYDGNTRKARLVGIEYVISNAKYQALPQPEKQYWHPHDGEVASGLLRLPGLPDPVENKLLGDIRTTWGKTWHTWEFDRTKLPLGEPHLMWAVDVHKINSATRKAVARRKEDATF